MAATARRGCAPAIALAIAGCGDAVTAGDCAALWNATGNGGNRAIVAEAGMAVATFTPFRDGGSNTGRLACAAFFRVGPGRPWIEFSSAYGPDGTLAWTAQPVIGGDAFGSDSPEGPRRGTQDAAVRASGAVSLP